MLRGVQVGAAHAAIAHENHRLPRFGRRIGDGLDRQGGPRFVKYGRFHGTVLFLAMSRGRLAPQPSQGTPTSPIQSQLSRRAVSRFVDVPVSLADEAGGTARRRNYGTTCALQILLALMIVLGSAQDQVQGLAGRRPSLRGWRPAPNRRFLG